MKPGLPSDYITGEKRYLTAITLLITAIFLTGFISRVISDKRTQDWDNYQAKLSENIGSEFLEEFSLREKLLTEHTARVKFIISELQKKDGITALNLNKSLINFEGEHYSILLVDESLNPVYFSKDYFTGNANASRLFTGEKITGAHFYETPFAAYLVNKDTIVSEKGKYFLILADPVLNKIETKTSFPNNTLGEASGKKTSQKFLIGFSPDAVQSRDGRDYNIRIKNQKGELIGFATFTKPGLRSYLEVSQGPVSVAQSLMVLLVIILIPFALKNDLRKIPFRALRTLLLVLYLVLARVIIYSMDFVNYIFPEDLTDPAKFASGFGYGIVKSPIDFTITVLFFFAVCLIIFREIYKNRSLKRGGWLLYGVMLVLLLPLYYLLIRAYAASVKSIIFDSSIRYFKEPEIFPALPTALMNLAALFLSVSFYLLLITILIFLFSRFVSANRKYNILKFIAGLGLFSGIGIAFIGYQRQPLINLPIILMIILFTFIVLYLVLCEKRHIFGVIFTSAVFASITGVAMLNLFNSDLERESLKTTATEINRRSESLIYFLLNQSLIEISGNAEVKQALSGAETDPNSAAFTAWNLSSLRKEVLNSSVTLLNLRKAALGGFTMNIPQDVIFPSVFRPMEINEMVVLKLENREGVSYFSGIVPVFNGSDLSGYVIASVAYNPDMVVNESFPDFLLPSASRLNSVVDQQALNIVIYDNPGVKTVKGNFYPTNEQVKKLWSAEFSEFNELWTTLEFNEEMYLFYFLKTGRGEQPRIISAGLKERELSWSLFNFFKLFILQTVFILLFYFLYQFIRLLTSLEFRVSYRTQLFIAFLIIALLPLIAIAVYNRMNEQEKSINMLRTSLREKALLIEKHVTQQLINNKLKKPETAFTNAAGELGITFFVYQNSSLKYTSAANLALAGVVPRIINPFVTEQLVVSGALESFHKDYLLGTGSYSVYRKITLAGNDYILGVNESLNPVSVVTTILEIDVFVIGIYSFAVVIIVLLSGFLSNRISQPIAKLTKATQSIAHGDLNVAITVNQRGEIGELIEGFKFMTSEIRRSQKELAEQEREMAWREIAKQVAHEIKNPLTPMKLSIQQLIASQRDKHPDFNEMFEKITNTVLNQIDILNQIAGEFSRFAKMPGSKSERTDLIAVIKDVIALYTDEKIKLKLETGVPAAIISGDIAQLRRLLINFIRNSIQAGAGEIRFNLQTNENFVSLFITDNGSGISEENREKIFNKNFTTKESGMGLGLKLSRRYIESLGGSVALIKSEAGNTVFEVKVPVFTE
ncbi:MAG: HAMP domain-containing protein [Ignavibacteriaceae bacterium]|nr:HAMP domain-containing protein [Ignavibacteriaceae bacterium]